MNLRVIYSCIGALTWTIALAQQPATVTYSNSGASLKTVFADLSAKTGEPWLLGASIADRIIVLHVKDVPVTELQERIASAFRCEWQKEKGGQRLVRSSAKQKECEQISFKLKLDEINADIARINKERASAKPITETEIQDLVREATAAANQFQGERVDPSYWRKVEKFQQRFPNNIAGAEIARIMDPKTLARLMPGDRMVFSTQPTAAQLPLPASALRIVEESHKEQARLADLAKEFVNEEGPANWIFYSLNAAELPERPVMVMVIATRNQYEAGVQLEVRPADRKGRIVSITNYNLGRPDYSEMEGLIQPKSPPTTESGDELIEPSPFQKALGEVFNLESGTGRKSASKEVLDRVLAPLTYDPLGYTFGDTAIAYADRKHANLVAAPSDNLAYLLYFASSKTMRPSTFSKFISNGYVKGEFTEAANWIQIRSKDPVQDEREFLPRPFAQTFVRRVASTDVMGLEDWAGLAAKNDRDPMYSPIATILSFMVSMTGENSNQCGTWESLRFYGLLNPNQRRLLSSGESLPFSSLDMAQRQSLTKFIFRDDPTIEVNDGQGQPVGFGSPDQSFEAYNSIFLEVTQQLPNGIPLNALVSLRVEREPGFMANYESPNGSGSMFMNIDSLAWQIFVQENPDYGGGDDQQVGGEAYNVQIKYTGYAPASQNRMNFTLRMSRLVQKNWQLMDSKPVLSGKAVPFDQLPDSMKKEIRERVEQIKKTQMNPPIDVPPPTIAIPPNRK